MMGDLSDEHAKALHEVASAQDILDVATLRVDQLKDYHASGTSYATYASDADLSKEFDKRNLAVRDAQAGLALAEGRLRDVEAQLRAQVDRQLAAKKAKELSVDNEKKRREELKNAMEAKPKGPEFTPS